MREYPTVDELLIFPGNERGFKIEEIINWNLDDWYETMSTDKALHDGMVIEDETRVVFTGIVVLLSEPDLSIEFTELTLADLKIHGLWPEHQAKIH